jgi:hypothetical protein
MQRNSFVLFCILHGLAYLLENLLPWQWDIIYLCSVLHKNSPLCWRMMLVTGGWVNVLQAALSDEVSQHSII